jgi:hypothetical protein
LQSVHSETYHASQPASQPASNRCYGPTINPIELLKSMENTNPKNKAKEHKIVINQQPKQINKQTTMLLLLLCSSGDHANAKLPRTLQQIIFPEF